MTALGVVGFACCELLMMRAQTPGQFATALKCAHVPLWVVMVSLVGFVRLYLRAGRPWLAWAVCGLRTLALLLNFLVGQNIYYREITAVRRIPFLGEPVSVAVGVPNPWMLVAQLSALLLLALLVDASIIVWRRGDRQKALLVGGSMVFFALSRLSQSLLVFWGILPMPITGSLFFMESGKNRGS